MAVNRLTLGGNPNSFSNRNPKWRITDVIVLLIFMIISYPVYYQEPFQRQFYLNDLTISHPYALNQRVSDTMLFVYTLVIPLIAIVIMTLILAHPHHRWFLLYISVLGLFLAWFATSLFTNFIKNWIGRLRPDFLDRCQPKPGLPVDMLFTASEVCTTDNKEILLDGFRTTPSGHSSESFAGLGYLYLWTCGQLLTENKEMGYWRKLVALLPLLGASLIALSRTQDYRHHFVDVLLGSIFGYVVAYFNYRRNFPPINDPIPFKPILDDSDVTLEEEEQELTTHTTTPAGPEFRRIPLQHTDEEALPLTGN
ncbi:bifunctional diacylglycerol diphosphate phosphatase/phosphatidate phosphatase NDAI_0C03990 [Naumovozyma dairenensis CBS 421]|uniref:Phosphatidic acid phosphatase type 2/haloperoxidase domain-containing protein n=1 Tax=Naumovozyma dairenensis (strain ATCC 10597 / BCRC 20456 / CBS 421 / NBRC 0211 / NRRL Y-12639) TaxID=1071378 RepID=G0W8E8_NAUDC|nr:hypothetical protein NDAI_0C03990 [Naumovozyma dairenensis CBS 421]CCD24059.1 hypothetical protein NDAI_0C03990 [Naumovozyma dairenensis CBS 421]